MAGRYWISGVQLGVMKALGQRWDTDNILSDLVREIEDKQFVGNISPDTAVKMAPKEPADEPRRCPKCGGATTRIDGSFEGDDIPFYVLYDKCVACGHEEKVR